MDQAATRRLRETRRGCHRRVCASEKRCTGKFRARTGLRFYNSDTGRWLNRDPLTEIGFHVGFRKRPIYGATTTDHRNELLFVANSPISFVDYLGLSLWSWLCSGDCAGQTYNRFTHCCCNDTVLAKALVPTGVKRCKNPGTLEHEWIEILGASAGFYHYGVSVPELPSNVTNPNKRCVEIKLSPCSVNIQAFQQRIADIIVNQETPEEYDAINFNCWNWVAWVIGQGFSAGAGGCGLGAQ